jgi:hypothetical protein
MADNTYNGWKNRETWLVNLWFGDSYHYAETGETVTAEQIEAMIDEHIDEVVPSDCGFVRDLIDLSRVDWDELAEAWNEGADEDEDEDEDETETV